MKILCMGDSHGIELSCLRLPEADVVVHCGDFSTLGKVQDISIFAWELSKLKYKHKLVVAGNHDWLCEKNFDIANCIFCEKDIVLLQDNEIEIGGLIFYGSPWCLPFNNWAFNRPESELEKMFRKIPKYTDVLITHHPPSGILDATYRCGSKALLKHVNRVKPKYHIFGHAHGGYGIHKTKNTTFVNCSVLDDDYRGGAQPILLEI